MIRISDCPQSAAPSGLFDVTFGARRHIFHQGDRTLVVYADDWDQASQRIASAGEGYDEAHDDAWECDRCQEPGPIIDRRVVPGS